MLVVGYSALLLCLLLSHGTGFFAHFLLFSAASLSLDPIPSAGESRFLLRVLSLLIDDCWMKSGHTSQPKLVLMIHTGG